MYGADFASGALQGVVRPRHGSIQAVRFLVDSISAVPSGLVRGCFPPTVETVGYYQMSLPEGVTILIATC